MEEGCKKDEDRSDRIVKVRKDALPEVHRRRLEQNSCTNFFDLISLTPQGTSFGNAKESSIDRVHDT
jgi:hypothetical protein